MLQAKEAAITMNLRAIDSFHSTIAIYTSALRDELNSGNFRSMRHCIRQLQAVLTTLDDKVSALQDLMTDAREN